jgi:hypothetical protein
VTIKPKFTKVKYCRVCKSKRILDLNIKRNYFLANLNQTIPISYKICRDCFFIFQGEFVGDKFLNHYYRQSPMLRRKEPTEFEIDQNIRQCNFLLQHLNLEELNVLEIGAHAGAFLKHLYENFSCKTYFEELSEEARDVLTSQKGLYDFRKLKNKKKIDLVVLRHVLEHIFDFEVFLNYLHSILSENGNLFIEVPDWTDFDMYTDPFIFEHLNQFNINGLINLLGKNGWQVTALEQSISPNDPATPNRVLRIIAKSSNLVPLGDVSIVKTLQAFSKIQYDGWKFALNNLLESYEAGKSIALYPASHLTFSALTETNLREKNILGFFDIDKKKQGRKFLDLTVHPPEKLNIMQPDLILIFTLAYEQEIRASFDEMGIKTKVISINDLIKQSWN